MPSGGSKFKHLPRPREGMPCLIILSTKRLNNIFGHAMVTNHHDLLKTRTLFHWDKDEELHLLCGGITYIHPHLSTITYLTVIRALSPVESSTPSRSI